jgi:ABC-type transporter Mla subunit MlaD
VAYATRAGPRRFYVELPQAPGVKEGVPVWYRGVAVGTVDSLGFTAERVRLRLAITRRDLPLRSGDRAHLAPMGVAGTNVIDIIPGPPTDPLLVDGGEVPFAWPDTTLVVTPQQTDSMIRAIIQRSERAKDTARRR